MPYTVHAQEVYEEVELQLHSLLTSVKHRMNGHAHAQLRTWRIVSSEHKTTPMTKDTWQPDHMTSKTQRSFINTHVSPL